MVNFKLRDYLNLCISFGNFIYLFVLIGLNLYPLYQSKINGLNSEIYSQNQIIQIWNFYFYGAIGFVIIVFVVEIVLFHKRNTLYNLFSFILIIIGLIFLFQYMQSLNYPDSNLTSVMNNYWGKIIWITLIGMFEIMFIEWKIGSSLQIGKNSRVMIGLFIFMMTFILIFTFVVLPSLY